ncbi:glycine betaine ABC transporter substrate-binding protein [Roseomonas marmotae]|uniref:Glycine betaine ABC transporter substrate-binding protein n=1 Tax=Roseomonas marmotae TaxID=2768161 RepID=A0ABS3K8R0_9PROT|nr:glycine betaine ABC transporter substrate-binding protein [Roseomonas marmotae]MBO1073856.1 glycine betaine ABC transporter substrate-binding protein [Roseomonas marmotae]QTI78516.1 glycine betaine ABC transporter substrate-binding protein [Roseomonas marmotae]
MLLKKREFLGVSAGLAAAFATGVAHAQAAKPIKLGFAAWADAEFVTKLAARLIQDRLKTRVVLVQTDVAPLYQGITRGDVDAMLMCWLPQTHADYWKRVDGKAERLGTLYGGAKLGWVVPAYVPESEVASIADLAKPEVRSKFGGRIQGIEPGAGLTRLSNEAVKAYGLDDYTLQESSEAAMLSMIDRALRRDQWVVATAWSPHWMFGKYELRYLADPKQALGGEEEVVGLGRPGLGKDRPEIAAFLSRLNLPLNELESAMLVAQEKDYDTAVAQYIEQHAERVNGWFAQG